MKRMILLSTFLCALIASLTSASSFTSSANQTSSMQLEGLVEIRTSQLASPPALDNWTNYTNAAILASPKLADLNGDNVNDILLVTYDVVNPYWGGWLYVWDGAGNSLTGFPIHLTGAPPGSPVIGDLDHDGDVEIVQGTWNYLYVFNADGSTCPGWPQPMYITQAAALADLDGDNDLEIIVPVSNQMRVYHHTGAAYAGFPVSGTHDLTAPTVGDLTGDGSLEIVAGSFVASGSPSDSVYAWHVNGTPVVGFPVATAGSVKSPPALADLNNDGVLEIIADCWSLESTDFLYVFGPTGASLPGWPVNAAYTRLSSPSIANLDLDNDLEIVVGGWSISPFGEKVYAFHHTGAPVHGFPVLLNNPTPGGVNSTCTVGNIDDDEFPEIIIKAVNNIFALNHNGSAVLGFPVYLDDTGHSGTTSPTPAIGDPDGDGLAEIFAASCYNTVMLIDQPGIYNPPINYWPTFRRNVLNDGSYPRSALYPEVTVTMVPYGAPIVIPASGGGFRYNISVVNLETIAQSCQAWIMVSLPGGGGIYPLVGPVDLSLPGGATLSRDRTQAIPASAPGGEYVFWGFVGIYPNALWNEDFFFVTKLNVGSEGGEIEGGENLEEYFTGSEVTWDATQGPEEFSVTVCPNPFNARTVINYLTPEASDVHLRVYDTSGALVVSLLEGWQNRGEHQITFEGSRLPSGVYLYRLQAGKHGTSGKMVLLK